MDHFDPYNVLLAIATNIAVWFMTGFVVQGHKYSIQLENVKKLLNTVLFIMFSYLFLYCVFVNSILLKYCFELFAICSVI